ncbi:MAG: anthranilate phosphoribosyltransferase [Nitrospirae bacterium]|nr:anthranilate phosphoribosyltransferase [Nitrospirota bacterium]
MTFQEIIAKIGKGQKGAKNLNREEAEFAMKLLLEGKPSPYQVGAFLISLRIKEESPEELTIFTRLVRSAFYPDLKSMIVNPHELIDLPFYAGKKSSFHVGIPASLIMAGAGLKVVLHGDPTPPGRTSKSMILDVMGWKNQLTLKERIECFQETGWSYLDITQIHPSVKTFLDLRMEIGLRSVFHTLARFLNPFNAASQIVGVSHPKSFEKIAEAMKMLGISRGLVIRGLEGESEAGLSGPVEGLLLDQGNITKIKLDPALLGIPPVNRTEIEIRDPLSEALTAEKILDGSDGGDKKSLSLWNACIGLYLSGKAESMEKAYSQARESLESGKAFKILKIFKNKKLQPIRRS